MPPIERDAPRDMDKALRHQHSASSDQGSRALVIPMWDSSDPERAPPPLPLNPQSPGVVSRAGTSSAIQSAHAALTEKARESAMVPHIPKRMNDRDSSPEKSLLRGSQHRRMQSLQPASVKDYGMMIEAGRESNSSTPRSSEKTDRPSTPSRSRDPFVEPRDEKDDRGLIASPRLGPSLTPIIRPSVRRPHSSILGENTPPQSATMLALQNMGNYSSNSNSHNTPIAKEPETPLANITNASTALVRAPQSLEVLSNQILTLTNIATTLQKEMSQLSRRSRDNATDLLSLKEATNSRDEDIRKSLRELISDAKAKMSTRDQYGGPLMLEGRYHSTSPTALSKSAPRPFSLPRIPSPNSFAASLDRESSMSTPSLYGSDSPAIIALLEKILREMGTREGQDSLLAQLTELSRKLSGMAGADKVDELVRLVKSNQQQAVVPAAGGNGGDGGGNNRDRGWSFEEDDEAPHRREINYNRNGSIPARGGRLLPDTDGHHSPIPPAHAAEVLNEDVIKAIRTVKDSVAQGGGLTAEVKALVRELRGEVLGMGREIGRRLDEVAAKGTEKPEGASNAEMTKVVEEGLEEMKQHMNNLLREHRRQSLESVGSRETTVDYKEIYNSMRAALKDSQANKPRVPELRREDVFQAVKDAWEKYKPEIEIQQIGLERDEVLECLQEGLRAYAPRDDRPPAATKDEVFKAVVEGLKHFVPPQVDIPATLSRDEILEAVRECLEEFEFPVPPPTGPEITKDDMLDAVKEGLHTFDFPTPPPPPPPGPELTREDMLDAVNEGLHTFDFAAIHSAALVPVPQTLSKGDVSDAVKQGLKSLDLSDDMLEAVREGVHSLNLTNDMAHAVKEGLESFDFASTYSSALVPRSELSRVDVVDAVKEGLESIDVSSDVEHAVAKGLQSFDFAATYSSALVPHSDISRVDVVDAVKEGLGDLSSNVANGVKEGLQSFDFSSIPALQTSSALVPTSPNSDEVVQRLLEIRDYLEIEFKAVSEEAKQNIAASGRDTEQVLDATKDGFEKLRQDIEVYVDRARGDSDQEEFMAHLVSTLDSFRVEIAELVAKTSDSSKALVREEIESLRDTVNSSLVPAIPHGGTPKEIIEAMQEGFGGLRSEISTRPIAGLTEILDALQEGLGDIRTSIDKLSAKPADLTANDEILDALKSGLDGVKSEIDVLREESRNDQALAHIGDAATAMVATESVLKHDDIKNLEVLISQLGNKVEALESAPPPVIEALSKEDLTDMEDLLRNVAGSVAGLSSREPLEPLEDMLRNIQESVAGMAAREPPPPPEPLSTDAATREDVEAIENILRNTKARLEDLIEGEQAVRKDHIDTLETLMLEARESITGLSSQVEILSSKEDVTMVESLVTQIISSFDEMKERHEKALEDPEKVTKTDIDAIEAVCHDTKNVIEQIVKADLATLPTKEDLQGLENLLAEFRERIDSHASSTAKAFEERQAETVGVSDRVIEVKSVLEQFRDIVGNKLEDGAKGIDTMNAILDNLGDIIRKNANISDDLKEMFETMKEEFDESRAGVVGAKLEADDKFQITTDTLVAKLDERMGELFAKYDEFQQMQEDRAAKGEERDAEMEAAVIGTKAIAEELKTLIDTLGTAVTDSMEKMEEASRTVFDRVEDLVSKAEENHNDGKVDHQLTRDTVQEAIGKVDGLQGHVAEFQPKILETLQEVISLVGQHYEHAKTSADVIQQTIEDAKPAPPEKYDDSVVHEKLDKLVDHTHEAGKAFAQLETLDKVHAQVKNTAAELAVFIAAQTQRIADEHEDREKSLQETIVALERRLAEKEQVEANVASLREEESRLKETINVTLRGEQEMIKEQFITNLQEEELRLKETNASLVEEQEKLKETFVAGLKDEQARLMEKTAALQGEQEQLKETFMASLKDEQARLMEANAALKDEQELLKETFMASLKDEQARLMEMNVMLKDEQEQIKETFITNLREEEARLKDANDALRQEQATLKETFLSSIKEEESNLREANAKLRDEQQQLRDLFREEQDQLKDSLRDEQQQIKDNFRDEQQQLRDLFREEQDQLKDSFFGNLREEEQRLKEANATLREEQEQLKASFKEDQERFKVELLSNLMEEQLRLKEANASLREEQETLKAEFLATLKNEEARLKESLHGLRGEQEGLNRQKMRLSADLSSLDTALRLRREELHDMEARAEGLERRILEGVMDHSRVLLMAKNKRANSGRDSMSRKRVPSDRPVDSMAAPPPSEAAPENTKPRTAFNLAMSGKTMLAPVSTDGASRRILSLSQINNNVATGGVKRSQSVRTAGAPARLRKASWTGGSRLPGAKGYGDLDKDDKENIALKESDEDNENEFNEVYESQHSAPPQPSPVDISVSGPESNDGSEHGEEHVKERVEEHAEEHAEEHVEEHTEERVDDDNYDIVDDAREGEEEAQASEAETLRRSSRGSTVITGTESFTGTEEYSDDYDDDDAQSDWTESVIGAESAPGATPDDGNQVVVFGG